VVLIERLLLANFEALGLLGGELVVVLSAGHDCYLQGGQLRRGRYIGVEREK
jgi:hypothetical protein